ncbi:MAG: LysR family transcriptional regulator [Glaciecola sp.]
MVKADDIVLFVQVVEQGSFSKVADMLNLTNSVVSKRIGRLEDSLQVQLLYRTTRKLNLTDAGRLLFDKARIAKDAMQEATDIVNGYSKGIKGTIRITMPDVSANLVLSRAVAEFCNMYPDVNIETHITNRFIDLIDDGFDLAIRTANLEDSSLIARRLVDSNWVVCASPKYLQQQGKPRHPLELADHECLVYKSENQTTSTWDFSIEGISKSIAVTGRYKTNNLHAVCQAALADLGIACLPQALAYSHIKQGELLPILGDFANKSLGIYAMYPKSKQPDQKLKLLIEHFRAAFNKKQHIFTYHAGR